MGHPQFNRQKLIEEILEKTEENRLAKIIELSKLTDNQLYLLCRS